MGTAPDTPSRASNAFIWARSPDAAALERAKTPAFDDVRARRKDPGVARRRLAEQERGRREVSVGRQVSRDGRAEPGLAVEPRLAGDRDSRRRSRERPPTGARVARLSVRAGSSARSGGRGRADPSPWRRTRSSRLPPKPGPAAIGRRSPGARSRLRTARGRKTKPCARSNIRRCAQTNARSSQAHACRCRRRAVLRPPSGIQASPQALSLPGRPFSTRRGDMPFLCKNKSPRRSRQGPPRLSTRAAEIASVNSGRDPNASTRLTHRWLTAVASAVAQGFLQIVQLAANRFFTIWAS